MQEKKEAKNRAQAPLELTRQKSKIEYLNYKHLTTTIHPCCQIQKKKKKK
jgi:hypothetical protein